MTNLKKFSAIAAVAILYPTYALAELAVGDVVGTTEAEIRASMEGAGYAVSAVEIEADEVEIEASLNGQEYEIDVSPADGTVAEIEMAEADDDEDEDEDEDDDNEDDSEEDGEDDDDADEETTSKG